MPQEATMPVEPETPIETTPSPSSNKMNEFVKGKYFKIFMIGLAIFAGASALSFFLAKGFRTAPVVEEPTPSPTDPVAYIVTQQSGNPRAFDIAVDLPLSTSVVGIQFVMTAQIDGTPITTATIEPETIPNLTPALQTAEDGRIQLAFIKTPQQQFFPATRPLKIATINIPEDLQGQLELVFDAERTKIIDLATNQNMPIDVPVSLTFDLP